MKDGETFRKCDNCGSPTANPWTGFCSDLCLKIITRKRPGEINYPDPYERIRCLQKAFTDAVEIIHDEFCGTEHHPFCIKFDEFKNT